MASYLGEEIAAGKTAGGGVDRPVVIVAEEPAENYEQGANRTSGEALQHRVLRHALQIRPARLQRICFLGRPHPREHVTVAHAENGSAERRAAFDRAETEHAGVGLGIAFVLHAGIGLGAVLDHQQLVPAREIQQRPHFRAAAEKMCHENQSRGRRNGLPPLFLGRRHALRIKIDRHRHQPMLLDNPNHVGNRDRRDQHFAAARQIQGAQQEIEPAAHGEARQRILSRWPK